jgi:hypothetical protein
MGTLRRREGRERESGSGNRESGSGKREAGSGKREAGIARGKEDSEDDRYPIAIAIATGIAIVIVIGVVAMLNSALAGRGDQDELSELLHLISSLRSE